MLPLTRILTSHADQVAAKVKASALRMILFAIRDLGLHAVLPAIESRLSGRTLSVMGKTTRELLDAVRQLGALHRRFVTTERIRQSFVRRLKKERLYLEKSQPGSDIGPDFDALWQT